MVTNPATVRLGRKNDPWHHEVSRLCLAYLARDAAARRARAQEQAPAEAGARRQRGWAEAERERARQFSEAVTIVKRVLVETAASLYPAASADEALARLMLPRQLERYVRPAVRIAQPADPDRLNTKTGEPEAYAVDLGVRTGVNSGGEGISAAQVLDHLRVFRKLMILGRPASGAPPLDPFYAQVRRCRQAYEARTGTRLPPAALLAYLWPPSHAKAYRFPCPITAADWVRLLQPSSGLTRDHQRCRELLLERLKRPIKKNV
jgi:hypothetical protein